MTEEFNLSEKIVSFGTRTDSQEGDVRVRDVKEFIRLLKEETRKHFKEMQTDEAQKDKFACDLLEDLYLKNFDKVIDKLAGEKLSA